MQLYCWLIDTYRLRKFHLEMTKNEHLLIRFLDFFITVNSDIGRKMRWWVEGWISLMIWSQVCPCSVQQYNNISFIPCYYSPNELQYDTWTIILMNTATFRHTLTPQYTKKDCFFKGYAGLSSKSGWGVSPH